MHYRVNSDGTYEYKRASRMWSAVRVIAFAVTMGILAFAAFTLMGCDFLEPKYPSPVTGQPMTALQLMAEDRAEKSKEDRTAAEERDALAAEQAKAKAELQAKALAADKAYKARLLAAKKSNADAQAEADAAKLDYETALAEIDAAGQATVETLTLKFNAIDQRQKDAATAHAERYSVAYDTLQLKAQQQGNLVNGVAQMVQSVPGVGAVAAPFIQSAGGQALLGLLGGGTTIGLLARRGGKKADDAYDAGAAQAKKDAEEARAKEHAAWDESLKTILLLTHQPPAQLVASLAALTPPEIKSSPAPVPPSSVTP